MKTLKEIFASPRRLLVKIVQILERLEIPYVVTGGMAVFMWGRPRYTADIDTVIELQTEKTELLAQELMKLGETGYVSTDAIREAIRTDGKLNFIHSTVTDFARLRGLSGSWPRRIAM